MNDWSIHNSLDTIKLQIGTKKVGSHLGFIYAIEYGEHLKIGSTGNAYTRMSNLISSAKNYGKMQVGKMLISPPHTNYRENEKFLHQKFKQKRLRAELFDLELSKAMNEITQITLLDETEKLERKTKENVDMFIGFVKGENELYVRK